MAPAVKQASTPLTASYTSPSESKKFTYNLSSTLPDENDIPAKTKYLSDLRSSVKSMQDDVNLFLTKKMKEDKTRESQLAGEKAKHTRTKTKEEEEEENYGEEVPEEDD